MEEEWDSESFEPKLPVKIESKWADEDADDDVKDNWEDEDEEEKKDTEKNEDQQTVPSSQPPKKSKKNLARKIEEKERQEVVTRKLTPEEKVAEKLRQQKLQEEADLKVARETFGVVAESSGSGIDAMNPNTKEEFDEFGKILSKKINLYSTSPNYLAFVEELVRNISVNINSADLKKLKNTIENLQLEKAKVEKGDKAKKNKGKSKAKLRVEGDSAMVNEYSAYGDMEEYEDFM